MTARGPIGVKIFPSPGRGERHAAWCIEANGHEHKQKRPALRDRPELSGLQAGRHDKARIWSPLHGKRKTRTDKTSASFSLDGTDNLIVAPPAVCKITAVVAARHWSLITRRYCFQPPSFRIHPSLCSCPASLTAVIWNQFLRRPPAGRNTGGLCQAAFPKKPRAAGRKGLRY